MNKTDMSPTKPKEWIRTKKSVITPEMWRHLIYDYIEAQVGGISDITKGYLSEMLQNLCRAYEKEKVGKIKELESIIKDLNKELRYFHRKMK